MNCGLMFSSKTDNWETPQDFFDRLNAEFHFTLDPCADESNHKCSRYFTREQDGLLQSWAGETVFCNPPYGRELPKWIAKCAEESRHATVVLLIPARTDTKAFHEYIYGKAEIRFVRGRLKFGGCRQNAPFPSMVVVFERGRMRTRMTFENVSALSKATGCSLHLCMQAIVYADDHDGCTPLGYLKEKTIAVSTPGISFERRVQMFSKEEENE